MDDTEFWELIDKTRLADPYAHAKALAGELSRLPIDEIHLFGLLWDRRQVEAYRWDVWGAAYLIGGGCSDDGFTDFRSWLTLQGREVFEAAIADPDSLDSIVTADDEERYQYEVYPVFEAWQAATKSPDLNAFGGSEEDAVKKHGVEPVQRLALPMGEDWDFDDADESRRRLPRLAARFVD